MAPGAVRGSPRPTAISARGPRQPVTAAGPLHLGWVPMFWAFLRNFTCRLVPKFDWGVSNFSD